MKIIMKIIKYPCSACKKLTDGIVLVYQWIDENRTLVRFKKDCCGREEVKFFTDLEVNRYVKKEGGFK